MPTDLAQTETTSAWRIAHADVVTVPPFVPRRSTRGRGARTAVLVGLVLFVVMQVALHRAIDTEAVPLRDPIYAEKVGLLKCHPEFWAKVRRETAASVSNPHSPLSRGNTKTRILAIGSSRTQLCLDAERLCDDRLSVFNFGCAGCGPVTDALYLRRLFDDGFTCDTALVELHPAMLADMTPPFEARWLHDYRLRRHEVETLRGFGWPITTPVQFRPGGPIQTSYTFRFAALNAAAPSLLPCPFGLGLLNRTDSRGHVPGVEIAPADRPTFLAKSYAEYHEAFPDYRAGGPAVAAVRDMIAQLRQHGVRVALYLTPESSAFRGWYGAGKQEVISQFAASLAAEFGVPLIDARDWLPDDQFADGHHATPAGAATFTERLRGVLR